MVVKLIDCRRQMAIAFPRLAELVETNRHALTELAFLDEYDEEIQTLNTGGENGIKPNGDAFF